MSRLSSALLGGAMVLLVTIGSSTALASRSVAPAVVSGTEGQIDVVLDIRIGSNSSNPTGGAYLGSRYVFGADDGSLGRELWITDGTTGGTSLLRDIRTGATGSEPQLFFANSTGTSVFFVANNGSVGFELWKTDGTEAGTVLVKDLNPGADGSGLIDAFPFGNTILMSAYSINSGYELWKTDGTEAGTVLVKDIYAGSMSSQPTWFTALNGSVYFSASDATNGNELWRTDGTEAGTVLVKDIGAGTNYGFPINGDPSNFFVLNGKLWFSAYSEPSGYELWSSDGTEAGTNLLGDFNTIPSGNATASFSPRSAVVLGTTAVFNATGTSGGEELWVTDGTVTGTHMVADLYQGSSYGSPNSSSPNYLTLANGKVYFYATTAAAGNEPWVTDGTEAGTTPLGDLNPGSNGSALSCGGCASPPGRFNAYGDRVLFTANVNGFGNEPWITDGTAAGTRILADLRPGSTGSTGLNWSYTISGLSISQWRNTVSNSWFRIVNGRALFSADSGLTGNELWAFVSPPGSPRNVTAGASPNSATVSWSPPTSSGAGVITSYTVVSNPGAFTCTTATTSCTITGLLSNQDYTFSVTATTELGSSPVPGVSGRVRTPSPQLGSLVESLPVVTDMVSDTNLKQGSTVTILYRGFDPNEMVLLLLASNPTVIGSANADDNGSVAITGLIPPGAETGAHKLVLYAPISGFGAAQAITVSSSTPSGPVIDPEELPATGRGQHPTVYAWVLVLAGLGLLTGRRLIRPTLGNLPPRAR